MIKITKGIDFFILIVAILILFFSSMFFVIEFLEETIGNGWSFLLLACYSYGLICFLRLVGMVSKEINEDEDSNV